jgi:hypothetical protein
VTRGGEKILRLKYIFPVTQFLPLMTFSPAIPNFKTAMVYGMFPPSASLPSPLLPFSAPPSPLPSSPTAWYSYFILLAPHPPCPLPSHPLILTVLLSCLSLPLPLPSSVCPSHPPLIPLLVPPRLTISR